MNITDRLFKYISIRQMIWNVFCARASGEFLIEDRQLDAFNDAANALFKLIVFDGSDEKDVWIKFRDGIVGNIPVMKDIGRSGKWTRGEIDVGSVGRLLFIEFYSWNRYSYNTPEYIMAREELLNKTKEKDVDILISPAHVEFYVK